MYPLPVGVPVDRTDLQGLRYRCLEDCGFCCTFTPQVTPPELARLRTAFPQLPVVRAEETTLIAMQGGCGACTLLSGKKCTAYEQRPAHCRYFPFHVYFGRQTEAYANRSCRGVEPDAASSLDADFDAQVLAITPPFRLQKEQQKADQVHRQFQRQAREAGVWGDVDGELRRLLLAGPAWFDPDGWPVEVRQEGEAGSPAESWQVALQPFAAEDPMSRPYLVAKDLRWLGFHGGPQGVDVEVLREDGGLAVERSLGAMASWQPIPASVREQLTDTLARLVARDVFAGSVFHLIDDTDYQVTMEDAARVRLADTAADLAVRATLLNRMGIPWPEVAGEAERFYDSAFLDVPTIGGWL